MIKFKINKDAPLTKENVAAILNAHQAEEVRMNKLGKYYLGQNEILSRTLTDTSKPNNRIVHSYGNYITDTVVGYFMGTPVNYSAKDESAADLALNLKEIFELNDEAEQNVELAKNSSKFGVAYELAYLDEEANIRFKYVDPIYCIPIFDNTLEEEIIYFIRYYIESYLGTQATHIVEIYDKDRVVSYRKENEQLNYFGEILHNFGMVPVSIYYNNEDMIGDYELVISQIDAYDKLNSDSVNDFEQFADAYLVLKGMEGTETEDIAAMKRNRVLLLGQDAAAEWLTKSINDTYFQNTIKTIDTDIHKFAQVPAMSDASFGGNLSGIAIKYKLMGLENKVAIKERKFKKGLQRRIELITNILNLMGAAYDYREIEISFKRNIPANDLEAADMVNKIWGLVSDETAISQLPFVEDAAAELETKSKQMDMNPEPIAADPLAAIDPAVSDETISTN